MPPRVRFIALLICCLVAAGCGSTKQHTVTEQLLSSDAVDRAVGQIDFTVLRGRKVYLDTSYVQPVKNIGFVNDRYIVSSLRQQMAAAGCQLQDAANDAEVIVEPRIGALGTDSHEVVYGIPSNNLLSSVASIAPNAPAVPVLPEISIAKKNEYMGAAKIAVFAYERESRDPLWQSGIAQAESNARDVWLLGAGPFQNGTIYDRTHFAGSEIELPLVYENRHREQRAEIGFEQAHVFTGEEEPETTASRRRDPQLRRASHEEQAEAAGDEEQPPADEADESSPADDPLTRRLLQHLGDDAQARRTESRSWYNPWWLLSRN